MSAPTSKNAHYSRGCPYIVCRSLFSGHSSDYESVRYLPVDQSPRPFPLESKTICGHKPFADEFGSTPSHFISVFVACHPAMGEPPSTPVCMLLPSRVSIDRRHTVICEERRKQYHSYRTCFTSTLGRGRGRYLTYSTYQSWSC